MNEVSSWGIYMLVMIMLASLWITYLSLAKPTNNGVEVVIDRIYENSKL